MLRGFIKVVLKIVTVFLFRVKIVRKRKYTKRKTIYNMSKPY